MTIIPTLSGTLALSLGPEGGRQSCRSERPLGGEGLRSFGRCWDALSLRHGHIITDHSSAPAPGRLKIAAQRGPSCRG